MSKMTSLIRLPSHFDGKLSCFKSSRRRQNHSINAYKSIQHDFTFSRSLPRQARNKAASFSSFKKAPLLHHQLVDAATAEEIRYIAQSYAAL